MIKKSFIGLAKPRLMYDTLESLLPEPRNIELPEKVTLLLETAADKSSANGQFSVKEGDKVKTGQKLTISGTNAIYVTSTVTGRISSVTPFSGNFGKQYTAISIETALDEEMDVDFGKISEKEPFNGIKDFLLSCPGGIPPHLFLDNNGTIKTLVICGVDNDLLISTNQYMVKADMNSIKDGIDILKKAIAVEKIIFAVPRHLKHEASAVDAVTKIIAPQYPAASPRMIMKDVLGHVVPAGKTCEDMGVSFISAEAAASIGSAFKDGVIPVDKKITVIKKDGTAAFVSARIGTPLSNIFNALDIHLNEKDRIVLGGPMTGTAGYSADLPVLPDTDAVIIQDFSAIPLVSDYPCINCGECIRICPVNIPINMLVRLLEAGLYEQAEDEYDLQACIDCGLCSYVCPARIPIFQYIRLAKHELSRLQTKAEALKETTEEANDD